jgi:hypothetical protein
VNAARTFSGILRPEEKSGGSDGTRTRGLLGDYKAFITAAWNLNLPFCLAGQSGLKVD